MKTAREKTCANCRAYEAANAECHRHPVKPWPKMEAADWCEDHLPPRDATGWRADWPDREKLLELIRSTPGGLGIEDVASVLDFADLGRLNAALSNLRGQGYVGRVATKWTVSLGTIDTPRPSPVSSGSLANLTEPAEAPSAKTGAVMFAPYYERNRARPYSEKSPSPDAFIRATAGGQPLKIIMRRMREAGEPAEKLTLFTCLNAAKHLEAHGWIRKTKGPEDSAFIYWPGPEAIIHAEPAKPVPAPRPALSAAEQVTTCRAILRDNAAQALTVGDWAELAEAEGIDFPALMRTHRADLLAGTKETEKNDCPAFWLPREAAPPVDDPAPAATDPDEDLPI